MDSAPSLEIVMQALQVLYHGENRDGKEKASLWLGELQKSTFAWQISDQLLLLNHSVESCYFAAQTMRSKIQFSFCELPESSHESLKNSLLNHCTKISPDTPQVIVTQLCLALADLGLQMTTWENPIMDLINKFGPAENHWTFLLEVLNLFPEEVGCRSLRLDCEKVPKMKTTSDLFLQFLAAVVAQKKEEDERYLKQVLNCMSSWIKYLSTSQLLCISNNLLQLPFSILQSENSPISLHKAATDCICSCLISEEIPKMKTRENENFLKFLFDGVCSLSTACLKILQLVPTDIDRLINLGKIFTETCEAFLDFFIETPGKGFGDFHLIELLLSCFNHFEVANVTFTFWNRLSESLYYANKEYLNDMLKPYVEQLIESLRKLMRLDPSFETMQDCPDDFMDFRYECHELITDISFIVDAEAIFSQMFERLKQSVDSWPESEASIFIMSALAKQASNFSNSRSEVVAQVLETVLNARDLHLCVRHSCIKLVGELRQWIDNNSQYIEPCLRFLFAGLQSNHLASAASESIEGLCLCSPNHMTPLFHYLLSILESIDKCDVSNEVILGILKGCAGILGRMSAKEINLKAKQLSNLQLVPLNNMLEGSAKVVASCKQSDPAVWLDRLAAFFSHLNPVVKNGDVHPCEETVQQVWPILIKVFSKHPRDGRIIERCCRCIRFVVRCLGRSSTFLIEPIINQMVTLYQIFPHSCCLYLGSILVDEFGNDVSYQNILIKMLEIFSPPTFKLFNETSGLRNHPDIVDDLFRLCLRFVQRAPHIFVNSAVMKPLLTCATYVCCLDHKDANESTCKFLIELIETPNKLQGTQCGQLISEMVLERGQELMNHIVKASLFCLPNFMIHQISELLYELVIFNRIAASHWLEQTLKALPSHTTTGKQTVSEQQLADFHQTISSAEDWKHVSRTLQQFIKFFKL